LLKYTSFLVLATYLQQRDRRETIIEKLLQKFQIITSWQPSLLRFCSCSTQCAFLLCLAGKAVLATSAIAPQDVKGTDSTVEASMPHHYSPLQNMYSGLTRYIFYKCRYRLYSSAYLNWVQTGTRRRKIGNTASGDIQFL